MATQSQEQQFFNLHTSGIGYLSRVRWVDASRRNGGRRAEPFLSCAINALRGSSDDVQYTYFDMKVVGEEAIQVIADLEAAANSQSKVLVAFKAADIYVHSYERRKRDQSGRQTDQTELATLIKGRLIQITMAKVNGELVYQREELPEGGDSVDAGEDGAQAASLPQDDQAPAPASLQYDAEHRPGPQQPAAVRPQGRQQDGEQADAPEHRRNFVAQRQRSQQQPAVRPQGRPQRDDAPADARTSRYARN